MRSLIFVEKATPNDAQALIEAMDSTPENLVDASVYKYPATTTLKAVKDGMSLVFMPVQTVFMLESLGIVSKNSRIDTALALSELVKTVRWEAHKAGHGEMYFLCKEATTIEYATRHGFEEMLMDEKKGIGLFRMKL